VGGGRLEVNPIPGLVLNLPPRSGHRPPRRRAGILRTRQPRLTRWAPLLLLLLSLGIAATAIQQSAQASRSHRATAEGLLRDYAAFAAWSFRQHAGTRMGRSFSGALEPVARIRVGAGPPTSVTADELLAFNRSPDRGLASPVAAYTASYFFRVPLEEGEATFAGELPGPEERSWIAAIVREDAARIGDNEPGFVVGHSPVDGGERLLVYARVGSADVEPVVYGFEYDPRAHADLFRDLMAQRPLLPEPLMKGRSNTDLLAVQILSPAGRVLFASDDPDEWSHASTVAFDAPLTGLEARATVRPEVAGSLVIGGLPRSRIPFLVGLLILAAGLSAMAVSQLRREGELARLRSDFVASVSHELRTPLAQVRLFLETLRLGRYSTDEQREWILDNMERETTRLNTLVDNVLHFSRAESGSTGGDKETISLAEYLEPLVHDFAPLAAARRVRFETHLEPGLFAPLHAESFRQVILNLLDNAVKYGPQGQTVRVATSAMPDGVRVMVEDEGPGIRANERRTIWEPFRRGENAIGSVAVGSGIGLAVAREIVEWHGGVAWVEDAPGGGARFVVHLPGWRDPVLGREEAAGANARERAG
jgi:signal transduction histidine kinase